MEAFIFSTEETYTLMLPITCLLCKTRTTDILSSMPHVCLTSNFSYLYEAKIENEFV